MGDSKSRPNKLASSGDKANLHDNAKMVTKSLTKVDSKTGIKVFTKANTITRNDDLPKIFRILAGKESENGTNNEKITDPEAGVDVDPDAGQTTKPIARVRNYYDTPEGQRVKTIVARIHKQVREYADQLLKSERSRMAPIFKSENLWQKRMDWIVPYWTLHLLVLGKGPELAGVEAAEVNWNFIHPQFRKEVEQKACVYGAALTEQFITEIKNNKKVITTLDSVLFSFGATRPLPADLQCLEDALLADLALYNFDRFVWPGLPVMDRQLLLRRISANYHQSLERCQQKLETLPKRDQEEFNAFLTHVRFDPPDFEKLFSVESDDSDARLYLYFEDFVKKYRQAFPRKSKYQPYVELQDKLRNEGKNAGILTVIMTIEKKERGEITKEEYSNTRQGMNRIRKIQQKKSPM